MKTITGILMLLFLATVLAAQDQAPKNKLRVGVYANAGASSLVQGMGMSMNMYNYGYSNANGNNMMYGYASAFGGGISLGFPLADRWSINGNVGYMSRGAKYGDTYSTYNSTYRISYIDAWVFGQYNSLPSGTVKFTGTFGLTESTLISANSETTSGNSDMMNNMNRVDIGMVLGPGMEFKLNGKGAIQTKLLYNYGFINVFQGSYYDNGMHSNNAAFLLQVGYLFN